MIMLLLTHILLALLSMFAAGMSLFAPTKSRLQVASGLAIATLVSGTALVSLQSSNLKQACVTGIVYLAAVSSAIIVGAYKLSYEEQR